MSMGSQLKQLRENLGLSIKDVVAASEDMLDKTTLSRIERDERGLSLKAAYCFSKIYRVNMETLANIAVGKKISPRQMPFDTSAGERRFLMKFRTLSRRHQNMVKEVTKGLSLMGDLKSAAEGRRTVIDDLERTRRDSSRKKN